MVTNSFIIRLKQARKRAGVTQKDLGILVGMEPSSASARMNHYEKGRHTPDISMLKKMAEKLDVPLNYFFCEDETSAALACLIDKLSDTEKTKLILELSERNHTAASSDKTED